MKLKEKLKRGWFIQQKIIADTDRIERLLSQASYWLPLNLRCL